ncbi:tetratricopeptide repeat-containing sensor histidine kinase [Fluviicola taffensis]|uniref:histidine kinase n=1 Tax=Fluviicola taffensis (strain DSM 16823 / NCIMB 13979 / RW262) TaxID=755732 RepID=F2IEL4_FLUTR|nr:tetratricopeptide repeat-containing sensor histidine kinase [Fluviicola taffensis]AEA44553.1 histidine kinase [Fluviicola taffensis DSM 16823]
MILSHFKFFQRKKFKLLVLLVFVQLTCNAQEKDRDTNVWIAIFKNNPDFVKKSIATQNLAKYYNYYYQPKRGIYWAKKGLPIVKKTEVDSILWRHYDYLASLYDADLDYNQSIHCMLLSLELKKKAKRWKLVAGTYNDLGVVYGEKSDFVTQANYYYKTKKIYDQIGNVEDITSINMNIAGTYYKQGFYQKSLDGYKKEIPTLKKHKFWFNLYIGYSYIANCYGKLKQQDSAFHYALLNTKLSIQMKDDISSFESWGRVAYFCSEFDHFQDYSKAIDSVIFYSKKISYEEIDWSDYYNSLGTYEVKITHNYSKALENYQKSLAISKNRSNKTTELETLLLISKCYENSGDYKRAQETMREAYSLKESILTNESRSKIAEMQTRYETGKKEAQIKILNKENKLKQQTTYFLFGGLALLAFIIISLIRNNKLKQKNNKKLSNLNDALDEANQSKVKLFSILSHDLRSPVSGLYTYLQLLKMAPTKMNPEFRLLKEEQLANNIENLLNTMEDLLIWSKSQMDSFTPEKKTLSLTELLQCVLKIYKPSITQKEITLILPEDDFSFYSDENILQTVFRNILSNAIKHTPEHGNIRISWESEDQKSRILFFNSGIPIQDLESTKIFDWNQINSQNSGYGLKISHMLAEKVNIHIFANPVSEGTLFTVEIRNLTSKT